MRVLKDVRGVLWIAAACVTLALAAGTAWAECPGDTDDDAVVDVTDLLTVLAAWGSDDPSADLDGSGMVDVLDLLEVLSGWGPCGSDPYLVDYYNTGCVQYPPDGFCEEDQFEFKVEDKTLFVKHTDALYNCCLDDIVVTLEVEGELLKLVEEEILTMPCWCVCCYEIWSVVKGLESGEYAIEYWWDNYWTGMECYTTEIFVP